MKEGDMRNTHTIGQQRIKAPWHLWVIGVFCTLLFSFGVYDYFMMRGPNRDYLTYIGLGEAAVAYFTDYPLVFLCFWTINSFSAPIASLLLLCRSKWAVWGGLIATISMICLDILTFSLRNRWNVFGVKNSIFDIIVLLLTCCFFFYCRALARRGILR